MGGTVERRGAGVAVDELLQKLRELAGGNQFAWADLAGPHDLLRRSLREAVAGGDDEAPRLLGECWALLADGRSAAGVAAYGRAENWVAAVDAGRLHRNACGLVATAQVALAAARALCEGERAVARAARWAAQAAVLLGARGSQDVKVPACGWAEADPGALVDRVYGALAGAGWSVEAAAYWTRHWLPGGTGPPVRRLRVPVAGWQGRAGSGFVAELRLDLLAEGAGPLVEHPDVALRPLAADLLGAVERGWRRLGKAACWALAAGPGVLPAVLEGESLGAATAVGFGLLGSGRPYDAGCLVAARVTEGDVLGKVGGEAAKLEAALAAGMRRAVVAAVADSDLSEAEADGLRARGFAVRRCRTLTEAEEEASGLAAGLRAYFDLLEGLPDRESLPRHFGARKRTELYIEPDLLRCERKAQSNGGPRDRPGNAGRVAAEVLDVGEEALFGTAGGDAERRLSWAQAFAEVRRERVRAIFLAPPGQGKSLLAQMAARGLAREARELLDEQRAGVDAVPLPVVVSLNTLTARPPLPDENPDQSLRAALAMAFAKAGCSAETARYLADHAHEGRCFLFLDGLDDVGTDETTEVALVDFLSALKEVSWQGQVVLTSRPYGYKERPPPFAVAEYRLAPLAVAQQRDFVGRWFGAEAGEGAGRMAGLLARSPAVQQAAQNPFLLTLLCAVAEREDVPFDVSRTRLYSRALWLMLGHGNRAGEWLQILPRLAWVLFCGERRRSLMEADELLKFLCEDHPTVGPWAAGLSRTERAALFRDELLHKRLLVRAGANGQYAFAHRTFAEYLAASHMAGRVNRCGWDCAEAPGRGGTGTSTYSEFVDRKAWDPAWEQVLLFLAGQLVDPAPLLGLLADEASDDFLRHRLALAARCLPETSEAVRQRNAALVAEIGTTVFCLWWHGHEKYIPDAVFPLTEAVAALAVLNARIDPEAMRRNLSSRGGCLFRLRRVQPDPNNLQPTLSCVSRLLKYPFLYALETLAELGAAAATAELFTGLVGLLAQRGGMAYVETIEALGRMGAGATWETVARLGEALADPECLVRSNAAKAVGKMGIAAPRELVTRLGDLLVDPEWLVRSRAAEALGEAGAGVPPEVLTRLSSLLADPASPVRSKVASALGKLGSVVPPEAVVRLSELLADPDGSVRGAAAKALASLTPPARSELLVRMLTDPDLNVREGAASGLLELNNGAPAEVMARLGDLLDDANWGVRSLAAQALGKFGGPAPPATASRLSSLLSDPPVPDVYATALRQLGAPAAPESVNRVLSAFIADPTDTAHARAAEALGSLGAAAPPELVACLGDLLADSRPEVCLTAAKVLGQLGTGVPPEAVNRLGEIFANPSDQLRIKAAEAIGLLGAAAPPELVACLGDLLADPSDTVRLRAVQALGSLGAAAPPGLLVRLGDLLADPDSGVCYWAAVTWRHLSVAGLRFFESGTDPARVSSTAELSC